MDTLRVAGFLRFRNYAWFNWVLLGFLFFGGGGGRHGTGSGKCSSATSTALPFHLNLYVLFLFTGLQRARVDFIFRRQSSKWEREHAVNERRDAGRLIVSFFFFTIWCVVACFFLNFLLFFFKAADESPPPPTSFPTAASPLVTAPELSVG